VERWVTRPRSFILLAEFILLLLSIPALALSSICTSPCSVKRAFILLTAALLSFCSTRRPMPWVALSVVLLDRNSLMDSLAQQCGGVGPSVQRETRRVHIF
jgi:hypothetical protein